MNHVGNALLHMQTLVEPADHRRVVLSLLQIVRGLLDQLTRFLHKWRDRGRHGRGEDTTTTTTTKLTAAHRGSLRFTSPDTAGSSPNAKNIAAPINTNIEDTEPSTCTTPYVTATPAEAINPR